MRLRRPPRHQPLNLRIGDIVEVRSEEEVLATLDGHGELDALPFMPEMLQFCGQRFPVHKLAIKACDTANTTGQHRMYETVHLTGVRCDGQAHGGCQAGCLLYWKEAWLKPVAPDNPEPVTPPSDPSLQNGQGRGERKRCTRATLLRATRQPSPPESAEHEFFSCQATELRRAAGEGIRWWDVRSYVRDVRSGNAKALPTIRGVCILLFNKYQGFSRRFLPKFLRIHGARRFPFIDGHLEKTPYEALDLQPGEIVRVKTKQRIFETLDTDNFNRGLYFDCEMLKYCGQEVRVQDRVERIINEKTGKMLNLKNPCVILEDVICSGDYHGYCPRGIYSFWREIWLERM